MPYGDLLKQRVQRFETLEDLDKHETTIEEREEYEPHIVEGFVVYAGVDYGAILEEAEKEADIILWDGGNNDLPFYYPDLLITLADPHRPGHETLFYPGEANVRTADVVVLNKVDTAAPEDVDKVEQSVKSINPKARIIRAASPLTLENPESVKGKRVLVVEDGPTLTHGGMTYGAGVKMCIRDRDYATRLKKTGGSKRRSASSSAAWSNRFSLHDSPSRSGAGQVGSRC